MVPLSQSYIRDSTHLINILSEFTIQPDMLLVTLDITNLYTKIPHNEGNQSIKEMLAIHKPPNSLPHNSYIIELLWVVLITTLSLMADTLNKYQEMQWAPSLHPHMPTYL